MTQPTDTHREPLSDMPSPADRAYSSCPTSSLVGRMLTPWRGGPHVYLASREDIFHVQRLLGELPVIAGSTYVGIIGGLGTLNYVTALAPDRVILVDVNRDQVEFARCVVELIDVSQSRPQLVEVFFSRRFMEDEAAFLKQSGDPALFNDTLRRIQSKDAFQKFFPAIRDGRFGGGGLAIAGNRCCANLKLSGPQRGTPQGDNCLYFGEGWLASEESFCRLKSILGRARIEFVHSPVERLDFDLGGDCLYFHGSNVEDAFPRHYQAFVSRVHERLVLQDRSSTFVWFSTYHAVNLTRFKQYVRIGDSVHEDCAGKVAAHTKGRTVLELIPGTHCFGRELGAAHVDVVPFKKFRPTRRYDVVVSHILYGSRLLRMSKGAFEKALATMLTIADEVVVVEHNAESEDFRDARLLSVGELARFLSTHHGLGVEVEFSKGLRDDRRNVIVSAANLRSARCNRIVCLTPVRNEAWILDKFLACASLWADQIVILDQCSNDGSREIARRFPKVTLIENNSPVYDEPRQRRLLLEAGRRLPGPNTFVILDADEFLSANFAASEEWRRLATAAPGTIFRFNWANILPGFERGWIIAILPAAYVDDGRQFVGLPLHGPRLPLPEDGRYVDLREIKILHYQYTDWARMKSKQCWYQCYEYLLDPGKKTLAVYRNYHRMDLFARRKKFSQPLPAQWFSWYEQQGIAMKEIGRSDYWWDEDVVRMMRQHGTARFRRAAIWSRDWDRVRERYFPEEPHRLADPRGVGLKILHTYLRLSQPWSRSWLVRTADRILRRAGC